MNRSVFRLLFIVSLFILVLPRGGGDPVARDWVAPRVAAPGLEITGDPAVWTPLHTKALDPVFDGARGQEAVGDLMGFAFDQEVDRLSLRLHLYRAPGADATAPLLPAGVRTFVLLDYMPGGTETLPGGLVEKAPIAWDRAVELTEPSASNLRARVLSPAGDDGETERVRRTVASTFYPTLEASLWLPAGFAEAVSRAAGKPGSLEAVAAEAAAQESTPIAFYVFTTDGARVLDDLRATNAPATNAHNVAFMQHLNQGLTYTTVFRGERGELAVNDGDPANPDDGADELLAAHDYYNLPLNWHQGGLLINAAEWHDPTFNDWLAAGVTAGRYEMITSAYGQHMMPFLRDEVNGKAVDVENDLIQYHYATTPRVAWVPERVWVENPDNDGNGTPANANVIDWIGDDFADNGVWAVILDDYIHCGYRDNAFDDHHFYTYGGLKIIPIDNDFVGDVNWNAGNAWSRIVAGTADELIVYGNDAEIAAEVSQGAGNASALNNYIWILQQCSLNSGTVGVWKLTSALLDPGFTVQSLTLQSGTYGLLGGHGGYGGGNNSWYGTWAGYVGPSNLDGHGPKWNYGAQWNFTLNKILGVPDNDLRETAWYVLLTNLHETGWQDGGEISGWQHHYSNHIRSANAHAEGARWLGGLYASPTGAYTADFDDDGATELVMYNDRLLAVFDGVGGKLQWLFAKGSGYGTSVVGNDNAYWPDTDGDYNETNHVAMLSDVSVGGVDRESDLYSFNVLTGAGNTVTAEIVHADVTKTVTLTLGNPYLGVKYRAKGKRVYVKGGTAPDLLDLTWRGKDIYRVWDPAGGKYFGFKNTNTNVTAAVVAGTAGAVHNFEFEATLLKGDEFYGDSPFEVYIYGGTTSALDGQGHVPELLTLKNQLVDTCPPIPLSGLYYPGSDHLTLFFDDLVAASSVVKTGFKIDDDNDGVADVTLTSGETLTTTGSSRKLDFDLTGATAAALEALTGPMELLLTAGSVKDPALNGNPTITHLNDVPVTATPATAIQVDGLFENNEWATARLTCEDWWDSAWNGGAPDDTNEINILYADWDATYLYLGVRGRVKGNSWILYLDTDVNGGNGQTNLTAIDTWERGATFSAAGFKPDFHFGAYQHQGGGDSQTLWRLTSATTSVNLTSQILHAFDNFHVNRNNGGSELAIPWDVLYGLGPGVVPAGARIGIVASVCWDPEPNGELGGDIAPNNVSLALPGVNNFCDVVVDEDANGVPDPKDLTGVPDDEITGGGVRLLGVFPNPMTGTFAQIPVLLPAPSEGGRADFAVRAEVYDLAGRQVQVLFSGRMPAGRHLLNWDGRTRSGADAGAGVFFVRLAVEGEPSRTVKLTRVP